MWTGLAVAGGALVSGILGSEASKDAAEMSVNASDRAAGMSLAASNTMRADLSPYRLAGTDALKRMMYLAGLGGGGAGSLAYSGATDLVSMVGGIPSMNQRYADDSEYVKAWNDIEAAHRAKEGGRSYTSLSDANSISSSLSTRLRSQADAESAMKARSDAAAQDPLYGSLMKDFTLADFAKDPGYQFRQDEGNRALTAGAAARGLAKSSPGMKSLMRFNQDLASQEYGAAFGRFETGKADKINLLSYFAGSGQNAAAMTGTAGANAASGAASATMAGANAAAMGTMGAASSWNNALQGGMSNYLYQQRWDAMMKRMPTFGAGPVGAAQTGVGASPY